MSESFGVAGTLALGSSENDYLQILYLLNYPNAALPIFQSKLRSPFLSTQLYGLLGLHELDLAAFRRIAPRYAGSITPIHQVLGCSLGRTTVGDIAWNIGTNVYHPWLVQDQRRFHDEGHFIEITKDTACFSVGKIGVSPIYTSRYQAFCSALLSRHPRESCRTLLASTDWIDRLYGLLGTRLTDRAAFARALSQINKQCAQISYKESFLYVACGYEVARMPLQVLLTQIEGAAWDWRVHTALPATIRDLKLNGPSVRDWYTTFYDMQKSAAKSGRYFVIGGTGFGGGFPKRYQVFLATRKHRDASALFTKQLNSNDEIDRLYAWLGLRLSDEKAYRQNSVSLSDEILLQLRGCAVDMTTPLRIRREIDAGLYDKKVRYDLAHPCG